MFSAITKRLDKIKETGKKPSVNDITQVAQHEEETYERSNISKVEVHLNNLQVEENENELLAVEESEEDKQYQDFHNPEEEDDRDFDENKYHNSWAHRSGWNQREYPDQSRRFRNLGHQQYHQNMGHRKYNGYRERQYDDRGYYPSQYQSYSNNGYRHYDDRRHQNQQNFGHYGQHGQFKQGRMQKQNYEYNGYANEREARQDQPWVPIQQTIYLKEQQEEQANNIVSTSEKEEKKEDHEEPLVY